MDVLSRIAGIILPVFLITAAGYCYARMRGEQVTEDMAGLSRVNVELLSPVLLFSALASKDFDLVANLPLILAGLLISLGSGLLAWPIARVLGYDPRTFVPPMIYNNCGNMGVPLAVLAFGASALSEAVAMFVASTLVYFSVGVWIIESAGKGPRLSMRRTLANPMILSVLLGTLFAALRIPPGGTATSHAHAGRGIDTDHADRARRAYGRCALHPLAYRCAGRYRLSVVRACGGLGY